LCYLSSCKDNLPIYGIAKSKQLTDFCTSEKDVSRGISRVPLILARIYEEDIDFKKGISASKYKTSPLSYQKQEMSEAEKLIEHLSDNIDHRNNAQRRSFQK
jgi:hypothetical protein